MTEPLNGKEANVWLSNSNAGLERLPRPDCTYADHSYPAYSAKAMRDAIKAERESCAKLCDEIANNTKTDDFALDVVNAAAAEIRKRSNAALSSGDK